MPRNDRPLVDHEFAIEVVVIPPLVDPENLDPPPRVLAFLPNIGCHLIDLIPSDVPGQAPLSDNPVREQRQVILDAGIRPPEER